MSVVLSEHLQLLASAPDGIQKLRGLILELAVRGKLVPQDPNDEPASELLKRIAQERVGLEAEGTRKKSKATPQEESQTPVSVTAKGWSCARLGDVVEIVRGITFPSSEKSKSPENGRVRCLRTANVQDRIEWGDILYIRSEFVSRDDQMLRTNDIVMSMANSRELVGKVALVEIELVEPATFGGFLGVLRPHLILPRFAMAFLRAPTVRSSLIDSASQTTNIANISLAKLRPLGFPIPPLAEQHRIVAKIDELMALCDRVEAEQTDAEAAHAKLVETLLGTLTQSTNAAELAANWQRLAEHFDTLFTTESSLDALKQTVLQLAVMGKLVPQDPNDEPASGLLKRIAKERARLVAEGVCKESKAMPLVGEDEHQHSVPASWEYVRLQEICSTITDGTHQTPKYTESGQPFLSAQNVKPFRFMPDFHRYVSEADYQVYVKTTKPEFGDVLLTRVGAMIGEAAVIDKKMDFAIYVSLALLKPMRPFVSSEYVTLWLNSPFGTHSSIRDTLGRGVSAGNLNLGMIRAFVLPLPPINEQHRIVAKVDELMALCDRLKANLAESRTRHARLSATLIESALQAA